MPNAIDRAIAIEEQKDKEAEKLYEEQLEMFQEELYDNIETVLDFLNDCLGNVELKTDAEFNITNDEKAIFLVDALNRYYKEPTDSVYRELAIMLAKANIKGAK
jgi:hypothetical protein